jgi:hypothetical protein
LGAAYHRFGGTIGETIGGAPDGAAASIEDVGVDHRRADVAVAEQLLNVRMS